jgi:hypothetical protein
MNFLTNIGKTRYLACKISNVRRMLFVAGVTTLKPVKMTLLANRLRAMEQYWFVDEDAAADFFAQPSRSQVLRKLPGLFDEGRTISVAGKDNRVFSKDLDF